MPLCVADQPANKNKSFVIDMENSSIENRVLTKVVELGTDFEYWYALPPDQAVVHAFEQHARGNWYVYSYKKPKDHPLFRSNYSVDGLRCKYACGNFVAAVMLSPKVIED